MLRPPPKSTLFPTRRSSDLRELNFSGELLANIFLGNIKSWKDPRIVKVNPGTTLPDLPIRDRKSTPLNSSHANISYAVFCLKKKKKREAQCGCGETESSR